MIEGVSVEPVPVDALAGAIVDAAAGRDGVPPSADLPFVENLSLLVSSCREDAHLNPTGWDVLRRVAVRRARNLLTVGRTVDADPSIAARPLGRPIVVTGLPRTGTTLLQNLLALDPAHRALRLTEALQPVPPASEELAARWLDAFYRLVPDFRVIHPSTPDGPEECDALLQHAFASQHFDDMFDARAYSAWLATAALRPEYELYALQLRVLAGDGPEPRTWVLKSPSHLGHLDALLDVLPGCTVVVCHRNPREAVASYASLIFALRRAYSDEVSPEEVGRQALMRAATAMERALEVRAAAQGRPDGARFVDVAYRTLVDAPDAAVRAVYQEAGRPLGGDVEAWMRAWLGDDARRRTRGPRHDYDLARFGLAEADVDGAFDRYDEAFGGLVGT
jgi:hypothetical protein